MRLKQTNVSRHLVQLPERLWRKGFVKQMSFKSGVKGFEGVIDGESKDSDCDDVMRAR